MSTPMYRLALAGFQKARMRLADQLRENSHPEEVLIPALEAAYWAHALDDRIRKDDPTYKARSGAGPELMLGLKCVRNRGTHQLPMGVQRLGGLSFPMALPAALGPVTVQWLPLAALPLPDPKFLSAKADAAYVKRFEGKLVTDTLEEVALWFAAEQARTGSLLAA